MLRPVVAAEQNSRAASAEPTQRLRVRETGTHWPSFSRLYSASMTSRIGAKGQVVIPKAIRDQAQLHPGDEVEIEWDEDRIVIAARQRSRLLGGRFAHSGMAARLLEDRRSEPR